MRDEKLENALKLSGTIAIQHPTHPETRPCAACAMLVLADAIQDLRLELKRLKKQHDLCRCGLKRVDGLCSGCDG